MENMDQQWKLGDAVVLKIVKEALLNQNEIIKCIRELQSFSMELFEHSVNTALVSLLLGMKAGLTFCGLKEIYIAGLLHDYGKLLIPKTILEKKDRLTPEERKVIELHPAAGFLSLQRDTMLSERVVYAVLDHHEKPDGSGYGSRKMGDSITEYAKIISIADVYDAMASDRTYRKAIDINIIRDYLHMSAGRGHDYKLVMLFMELLEEKSLAKMEEKHKSIVCSMLFRSEYTENTHMTMAHIYIICME